MTSSAIAFIGNPINRQLEKRTENIVKEQRKHHPRFIVLNGFSIIYRNLKEGADLYLDTDALDLFEPQWEEACLWLNTWVSGVNPVNISVNVATVSFYGSSNGNSTGI